MLGVVLGEHDPKNAALWAGVEESARWNGYANVSIVRSTEAGNRGGFLRNARLDGVLLVGDVGSFSVALPTVGLACPQASFADVQISIDYDQALRDALCYLQMRGHEELLLVFNDASHLATALGRMSLLGACRDLQMKVPAKLSSLDSESLRLHYRSKGRSRLAVLCANDSLASRAITTAKVCGLECPRDLSVMSLGEDASAADGSLTTMRYPWDDLGSLAVRMLFRLVDQPEIKLPRRIQLQSRISHGTSA